MLGFMFMDVPSMRLGSVRTLIHPDHVLVGGGCTLCEDDSCKGNRIEWMEDPVSGKRQLFPQDDSGQETPKASLFAVMMMQHRPM